MSEDPRAFAGQITACVFSMLRQQRHFFFNIFVQAYQTPLPYYIRKMPSHSEL